LSHSFRLSLPKTFPSPPLSRSILYPRVFFFRTPQTTTVGWTGPSAQNPFVGEDFDDNFIRPVCPPFGVCAFFLRRDFCIRRLKRLQRISSVGSSSPFPPFQSPNLLFFRDASFSSVLLTRQEDCTFSPSARCCAFPLPQSRKAPPLPPHRAFLHGIPRFEEFSFQGIIFGTPLSIHATCDKPPFSVLRPRVRLPFFSLAMPWFFFFTSIRKSSSPFPMTLSSSELRRPFFRQAPFSDLLKDQSKRCFEGYGPLPLFLLSPEDHKLSPFDNRLSVWGLPPR